MEEFLGIFGRSLKQKQNIIFENIVSQQTTHDSSLTQMTECKVGWQAFAANNL
jgi:hypothetical protein